MLKMATIILDQTIEKESGLVKQIIAQARWKPQTRQSIHTPQPQPQSQFSAGIGSRAIGENLYNAIVSRLSHNTRLTAAQVSYLEGYEYVLGVFKAASVELRREMDILGLEQRLDSLVHSMKSRNHVPDEAKSEAARLQNSINEGIFFSNRYALFYAGLCGLALIEEDRADTKLKLSFGTEYDSSQDSSNLVKLISEKSVDIFRSVVHDTPDQSDQLKEFLHRLYTSFANQFSWATHKDIAKARQLQGIALKAGNFTLVNGEFSQKYSSVKIDPKLDLGRKHHIINSEEFVDTIWQNLLKLACYDQNTRSNEFSPANVIFTMGPTGCGKTFVSSSLIMSFADYCREHNIPLWAFTHSTTDYASEYQNRTANMLAALAKEMTDFPGIVIWYVADADNILLSRKDSRLTAEQRQTMGVYFKMLDGTMLPRIGKIMAIMDANYLHGIDDATKRRVFDEVLTLERFDKPEHFAALAKQLLTRGIPGIEVPESHWQDIGCYLLDSRLNHGEIFNIMRGIRGSIKVTEATPLLSKEEKTQYRNSQLGELITKDNVIAGCEQYIGTRLQMEANSQQTLIMEDYERFKTLLSKEHPAETLPQG
jgi:hypothetical protein